MAEERNIRIANMMIGNPPKPPIAYMLRAEQIVFQERDVRPIRNGGLPTAPQKRELEAHVFADDIAERRLQLGHGNVLVVQAPQELPVNRSRGMPGRLGRPQFARIAEDGKDIATASVSFGSAPEGGPKCRV